MEIQTHSNLQWISGAPLLLRFFDGEAVVFNETSAETHLLCQDAGRVLQLILSNCGNIPTLQEVISDSDDQASDSGQVLLDYLAEFERLGLIQQQEATTN